MAHPGRPRRRNKVNTGGLSQHIAQPQSVKQPIKEEPTNSLHDESDLISFRSDALARLIQNQELLESVTSKYFHTDKIIPPSSFPSHAKRPRELTEPELNTYLKTLGPEGVYFGDYEVMKHVNETLSETIKNLESTPVTVDLDDDYKFQKEKTQRLINLTQDLNDQESLDKLEQEYNSILKEYQQRTDRTLSTVGSYKKYSVKNNNVTEAPKDYNPRSINAMVNLNREPQVNGNKLNGNLEDKNSDNFEFGNNFLFQQSNKNMDDINNLFQRPDNPQQDDIVDDMGDLINFQGDDEDIIEGGAFDEDFLSQIDHSME